jgi:hypothetical protein
LCLASSTPSIFSNHSFIVHHPVNRDDWHLLAHALASDLTITTGLPDGLFLNRNPHLDKFLRALDWKMLIYFMAIWNILRPFGKFYEHMALFELIWYNFFRLWYHVPRKIWQPGVATFLVGIFFVSRFQFLIPGWSNVHTGLPVVHTQVVQPFVPTLGVQP